MNFPADTCKTESSDFLRHPAGGAAARKPRARRYYAPKAWVAVVDYVVATGQLEKPVDPAGLDTNDLLADVNAPAKPRT